MGRFINAFELTVPTCITLKHANLFLIDESKSTSKPSPISSLSFISKKHQDVFPHSSNIKGKSDSKVTNVTDENSIANNYLDVHWKSKWLDTSGPSFFKLTDEGYEVLNWGCSNYTGSLYLDHEENHSLYVSALNASTYLGINYEKGIGIDMSASVLEVGYDGRIIDVDVEILTAGITYMYQNGKFECDVGAGWIGFSFSVDIYELSYLFFGG